MSIKVSVVQSSLRNAELLRTILAMNGLEATSFSSMESALERSGASCPDIFICELSSRNFAGEIFVSSLRAICPETKIICLVTQLYSTEWADPTDEVNHRIFFMVRPLHPRSLLGLIQTLIDLKTR